MTVHRKSRKAITGILVLTAVLALVLLALNHGARLFRMQSQSGSEILSMSTLWSDGNYSEVVRLAEERLAEHPMDRDALLYAAYGRFFLGISRLSYEERLNNLNTSIGYLRLLKTRGDTPNPERVNYLLGKAYLLKGPYWADLAVYYLSESLKAGYLAEDSYEFLGRSYSQLGDFEGAMDWYEKAAETHPTDKLLLTLGEEAFRLGRYDDAAGYYKIVIKETRDDALRKRGLSQLGQLYYDVGNYRMAQDVLERLAEMDPENADLLFLLGETYAEMGMTREARSAWHKVIRIVPRHTAALRRLYD